jgi:hypothetical protein
MAYQAKPLYLFQVASSTHEIQEEIDSFYNTIWLEKHCLQDNFQLYHYTTLSGLRGILNERSFWLGHISSFNDPLEIQYGKDIVYDAINEALKNESNNEVRTFLVDLQSYIKIFGEPVKKEFGNQLYHIFVACFCELDDLLSQWRAYADHGGGYCLGFQFSSNTKISSNSTNPIDKKHPYLRKVIYEEIEQRNLVQQYINKIIAGAKKAFNTNHQDSYSILVRTTMMAMQAVNILYDMLITFKHNAFREEKEWRLIRVIRTDSEPENLQFREKNNYLIPYRPTNIFNETDDKSLHFPLSSVSFGPSLEPIRTRPAIELLLYNLAANNHQIKINPLIRIKGQDYILNNE